jgi:hypothetical protein
MSTHRTLMFAGKQRYTSPECHFCEHSKVYGVMKYPFLRFGAPRPVVSQPPAVHNTQPPQSLEFVD